MKLNESIMKNLKESEGRTYEVVVGFCGYIGVEQEYNVYALSRADAVGEALDNPGSEAEQDLSAESVEDLGDGNYEVVVSFAGIIGADNTYTVYAESEEEAEMYAIEEAKADLEVLSVDGTEFSYDETFECAKVKKGKKKLNESKMKNLKESEDLNTDFRGKAQELAKEYADLIATEKEQEPDRDLVEIATSAIYQLINKLSYNLDDESANKMVSIKKEA